MLILAAAVTATVWSKTIGNGGYIHTVCQSASRKVNIMYGAGNTYEGAFVLALGCGWFSDQQEVRTIRYPAEDGASHLTVPMGFNVGNYVGFPRSSLFRHMLESIGLRIEVSSEPSSYKYWTTRPGWWLESRYTYRSVHLYVDPGLLLVLFLGFPTWTALSRIARWYKIRRRPGACKACGYNLTGNVSGVCPECGRPVTHRTGKRPRSAP